MKKITVVLSSLVLVSMGSLAWAGSESAHEHRPHIPGMVHDGHEHHPSMAVAEHSQLHGRAGGQDEHQAMTGPGVLRVNKEIDGLSVTFHIMPVPAGLNQGGSHRLMIKVERDGVVVTDLMANSKAMHPNGASESKIMLPSGEWYTAYYDLGHAGSHQLMVLFKTADGVKHFGGVFYPGDGNNIEEQHNNDREKDER